MEILVTVIYLLIGFQFGARAFYWGHNISRKWTNFIVPLVFIPLLWPIDLLLSFFYKAGRECLFRWDT
jgi:hypothetical protein